MVPPIQRPQRALASIQVPQRLGADEQVDDKALVLQPDTWAEHDPFLMMAEDWFSSVGFDWHPHRGIETVTFVLEGQLEHRDNRGGHGVLGPGDAQWMTAGGGIIHSERALEGRPVHTLQLWLNLPAAQKLTPAGYQDLKADQVPVLRADGVQARVFSGRAGASGEIVGPAKNHVPVTMLDVRMEPGAHFAQALPAGDHGFLYALEGEGRFGPGGQVVRQGQVAALAPSPESEGVTELSVAADRPLRFLLWSGRPLREPVVAYGPFVMNTRDQIIQAFEDFRLGKFGRVPAQAQSR
ncbi:MAG TPA: pirin family protein [Myxococcales bacterium]|jgi:redox-sensitive bicupin YhaK (pirin superfamily)|nr:pirin family protein [Myxococcales bacterium]